MTESKQRKIGVILSYISIVASTVIQLLYTPFLIKMLGQSEYGLYSLISSIIGYLTVLDLGFGNAIIVYTAKYRAKKEYQKEQKLHGMFLLIFGIIGAVAGLLGLVLFFNVPTLFGNTMTSYELEKAKVMMLILSFNLAITFPFSIYSSVISAYEKFTFQKLMSILNTLLKPLFMIPLLFLGYKSIAMTVVITIINIAVMLSNYFYCRRKLQLKIKFQGFDKKLFLEIFSYSFFIFLGVLVDKANWSIDQFVLGTVSGTIAVSVYSVASQLNTLFVNLSTAVSSVMLPKMSKMVAEKSSPQQLTAEFTKVGRIQYFIIFLMASGLVLFGKEFIIWWVGKDFVVSYYVALILIIPVCFPLVQNLGLSIMQAMNKYKFKSISTFCMAIFNVLISIMLAKKFGAIGSAIGTAISLIICNIILINIYYAKVIKLNIMEFWKNILSMTIRFLIPVILILGIMKLFSCSGIIGVVLYGSIYTVLYIFNAYFLVMNSYEKEIIHKLMKRPKKELKL